MQYIRIASQRRAVMEKIQSSSLNTAAAFKTTALGAPGFENKMLGILGLLGHRMGKDTLVEHAAMRPKFLKAGIRSEGAPAAFFGAKLAFTVLMPLQYVLFRALMPEVTISTTMSMIFITTLAIGGFYIPDLWLLDKTQKRRQIILDGFPDALDLLVVCVQAGMGLDSAISRVAQETRFTCKELSDELHLFTLEMRAGMQRQQALKNLAMRTDLEQMQNMVTLLLQTDKFGTSVSQALEVFSNSMRTERMQRAEAKAGKLPIKLLFPLMIFIFPTMFIVILGPAVIRISHFFQNM
ncbi:type II secretion system F family protein [Desulfonatronum thiosulfatophilum]|nr:type II secretion system F family protein [Desulfonatronum thiosulfatophilum]